MTKFPWPPQSPAVAPIENLWSILKIKIVARESKAIKNLKRAIYKEWILHSLKGNIYSISSFWIVYE